jgi:hypothetical protein
MMRTRKRKRKKRRTRIANRLDNQFGILKMV